VFVCCLLCVLSLALQHPTHNHPHALCQAVAVLPTTAPKSNCSGNKKSVLIGINYVGSANELRGCVNDVQNVRQFILDKFGFQQDEGHQRVLTEDNPNPAFHPTRANIETALRWLVEGVQPHDSLFVHYSGHGATTPEPGPVFESPDGNMDTIVPVDYQASGMISDIQLHELVCNPLPAQTRLTTIFDCCHSGSILSLPFTVVENVHIDNRVTLVAHALENGQSVVASPSKADVEAKLEAELVPQAIQLRTTLADVLQFSGCRNDQTSADAFINGSPCGAMSFAFLTTLNQQLNQSYKELLANLRSIMEEKKFSQVPQLATGSAMEDMSQPFFM